MVWRGRRERGIGAHLLVRDDGGKIVRVEQFADAELEPHGPLVRLHGMVAPGVRVEVAHYVAGAEHEHALVPQRPQTRGELEMLLRRERFVDA